MKTIFRASRFWFLCCVISLLTVVVAGCGTTKKVDWNGRMGNYTFDQAVAELGPPDKQAKTSDGRTVADWIEHRNGGASFTLGTGFYSPHTGVAVGHTVGSGYQELVTRLTFGLDGKLVSWSKNY